MKKLQFIYLVVRLGEIHEDAARSSMFWATGPSDAKRQMSPFMGYGSQITNKMRASKFKPDGSATYPSREVPAQPTRIENGVRIYKVTFDECVGNQFHVS